MIEKYETIAALRRDRAQDKPPPEAGVFKALAAKFPGALAELDTLPQGVIETRLEHLRAAEMGGPIEPWMAWMIGYHALARAALRIRIRAATQRNLPDEEARALAEDASSHAGISIDVAFVRSVLAPPSGRVVGVVVARLGAMFSERVEDLRRALFPHRRASKNSKA